MNATAGFHHITLVSADEARARRFYGTLLGLTPARHGTGASSADAALYFAAPDAEHGTAATGRLPTGASSGPLAVRVHMDPGARRGRWGVGGVHHLALGVATRAGLLKWKRRLSDAGLAVSGPYDRGWFHSIYFADGDGQVVEIATAGPGYASDEPIDALGERVVMPASHQMRGGRDEDAIAAETHGEPVPEITPDMVLTGLHHITGLTDDLARADDFYQRALGLRIVKRSVNQDDGVTPHWFWANYDGRSVAAHSSYTLFEWKGSTYRARQGRGQAHSIAFRAANVAELHAWHERLRALGIETSDVVDDGPFRSIHFAAPDGQRLALTADAPGMGTADDAGAASAAEADAVAAAQFGRDDR